VSTFFRKIYKCRPDTISYVLTEAYPSDCIFIIAVIPAGTVSIKEERFYSLTQVSPDEHIFLEEFLQARNLTAPHHPSFLT